MRSKSAKRKTLLANLFLSVSTDENKQGLNNSSHLYTSEPLADGKKTLETSQ